MKTLIIGVGSEFRSDDRVGLLAARALAARRLEADVAEAGGEGADLMERWSGYDRVILIDATRSGAEPGTIHVLDAVEAPLPNRFFSYSTHAFSVAEAVELARILGSLPYRIQVFGIEGQDFSAGQRLSAPVEHALEIVVDSIASSDILLQTG